MDQLTKLKPHASDPSFQRQFMQVKANNKMKLAQYLEQATGISINPASMFDIQVMECYNTFEGAVIFLSLQTYVATAFFMDYNKGF